MNKTSLTVKDLQELRKSGTLHTEETAYWIDGNLIAENVITKVRRVVDVVPAILFESTRKILKG